MQTTEQAVSDFYARGGTLTVCPPGTALHPFISSVSHQSMIPASDADEDDG